MFDTLAEIYVHTHTFALLEIMAILVCSSLSITGFPMNSSETVLGTQTEVNKSLIKITSKALASFTF